MQSLFTSVDTLDASTYLHSLIQSNNAFDLQWVMPVAADPKNDVGTASSTVEGGATFSGNTANDIVLATGTKVSATMSLDMTTGTRSATYVEDMTPTLDGTLLLDGSIQPGSHLTEQFTTPSSDFQAIPQTDGTTVDLVNGGSAKITLDNGQGVPETIRIPSDALNLPNLSFIHYHR